MKFVMALFVVTIHCNIVNEIQINCLKLICTSIIYTAVPFFYVTSSYLLFRHIQYNQNQIINQEVFKSKLNKYWHHIAKMYVLWFIIYHIKDIKGLFIHPFESSISIINNFLFWGCGHLWYLWGLLLVLPIIYATLRYIKPLALVIIGFGLMCVFRLYSHFGSVDNPTWWQIPLVYMWQGHVFNVFGICYAWAYISVGLLMVTTETWKKLPKKYLFLLLIGGLFICSIDTKSVSIGYQPVAFALIALCLRWNIKSESFFLTHCRDVSTYIYLIHALIISISCIITNTPITKWILSLTISSIIALLISIIKQKRHTKKLILEK
jgi:hypothetical protein